MPRKAALKSYPHPSMSTGLNISKQQDQSLRFISSRCRGGFSLPTIPEDRVIC